MSYYQKLLNGIFRKVNANKNSRVLAFTATAGLAERFRGAGLFPTYFEARDITHLDTWAEEAFCHASRARAIGIFAFPLQQPPTSAGSEKWKNEHASIKLAQAFVDQLKATTDLSKADQSYQPKCVAILVPRSLILLNQYSAWRNETFSRYHATVIEHDHPDLLANIDDSNARRFVTIVLSPHTVGVTQPFVRFVRISEQGVRNDHDQLAKDVGKLLGKESGKTNYGYVFQGTLQAKQPCTYSVYSEETEQLRNNVAFLGCKTILKEVAEVLRGIAHCPNPNASNSKSGILVIGGKAVESGSEYLVIDGSAVGSDESLDLRVAQKLEGNAIIHNFLAVGDICLRETSKIDGRLFAGIFKGFHQELTTAQDIIIVRPKAMLNGAQRRFLATFLRSRTCYDIIAAKQHAPEQGSVRVHPKYLKELAVPIADEVLVESIDQLEEAKSDFTSWIADIDSDINSMIEKVSTATLRERLLDAGRLARQRRHAAKQVEDFGYRVVTQFPQPLASMWRAWQSSDESPSEKFRTVLNIAEGHTSFLAILAIVMSRASGLPSNEFPRLRLRQEKGMSFGDWFAVVNHVNRTQAFRELSATSAFIEVTQLGWKTKWEKCARWLMKHRNDISHGRLHKVIIEEKLLAKAEGLLIELYKVSDFLTEYKLIYITDVVFNSMLNRSRYKYRELSGDSVLVAMREDTCSRVDLEKNSLYLKDRRGKLHLMRPWLHFMRCPVTTQMTTFCVERREKQNEVEGVIVKSYEHNTTEFLDCLEECRQVDLCERDE